MASPAEVRTLKMPVLIPWGGDDRFIPAESARWLHARIPGSRPIVYPATGHALMEERPDHSAADLDRFLRQ